MSLLVLSLAIAMLLVVAVDGNDLADPVCNTPVYDTLWECANDRIPGYYWDKKKEECAFFRFADCGEEIPGRNKFDTASECKRRCQPKVDGNWGPWNPWESCTTTCGAGTRKRNRKCNSPPPAHGGATCAGDAVAVEDCKNEQCIECKDGEWYPQIKSCLVGISGKMNYPAAKKHCAELGGQGKCHLPYVKSKSQYDVYHNRYSTFWLGMYLQSRGWTWNDGTALKWNKWGKNQPQGKSWNEYCTVDLGFKHLWHDYPCTSKFRVVCQCANKYDE